MVALTFLLVSSCMLGITVLRKLVWTGTSPLYRCTIATLTGMGCWCLILFGAGLAGVCTKPFFIVATMGMTAVGTYHLAYHTHRHPVRVSNRIVPSLTRVELLLCLFIAVLLVVTVICTFGPVYGGIDNDEIHTHLSIPAAWLRTGTIDPQSYPVSYMAGNGELLFMYAEAFSRGTGPRLVSWSAYLATIVLVFGLARCMMNRRLSLVAAAIVTINPLLFRTASVAFVDSLSTVFMLGAIVCMVRWYRGAPSGELLLGCALAGIGCGVKPTNIVYTIFYVVLVLITLFLRPYLPHRWRIGMCTAAILIGTAAPWPVRNMLLTGSPTFPPPPAWYATGLARRFVNKRIPYTDSEVQEFYRYVNSRYGDYRVSISGFIRFPWDLTMHPRTFQVGDSIGTVLLSLFPVAVVIILRRKSHLPMYILFYTILSSCSIYFLILPEARYFSIAYCTTAPLLALSLTCASRYRAVGIACRAVLIINIMFSIATLVRIKSETLRMVCSKSFRNAYIAAHTPYYTTFKYLAQYHSRGRLVVMYDSPIWYYLHRDFMVDSTILYHAAFDDDILLLDIDYSQIDGRKPDGGKGNFVLSAKTDGLKLVYDGGDARVYRYAD